LSLERNRTDDVDIPHTLIESLFTLGLTIVHPFYNEEKRLKVQLENWRSYSDKVKDAIYIILADDCSKVPIHTSLEGEDLDFNLGVYRIKEDLKWNTPGALNLGIKNSKTNWTLIMDSDCLLEKEDIESLLDLIPNCKFTYRFHRNRISDIPVVKDNKRVLPCSILFNKEAYKTVGGFDEDFTGEKSGGYGFFDNDFSKRLLEAGYWQGFLTGINVTEYMEDVVGPNIQQKTGVSKHILRTNKKLLYSKISGEIPRNTTHLNFEWEQTFENRRG